MDKKPSIDHGDVETMKQLSKENPFQKQQSDENWISYTDIIRLRTQVKLLEDRVSALEGKFTALLNIVKENEKQFSEYCDNIEKRFRRGF